jgi:hypothetical protein
MDRKTPQCPTSLKIVVVAVLVLIPMYELAAVGSLRRQALLYSRPSVPEGVCPASMSSRSLSACLADGHAYRRTLEWLYSRYGQEIVLQRKVMRT